MKRVLFIVIFALLFTGCGLGTMSFLVKTTDTDGNRYSIAFTKNDTEHSVKTSVTYKNKTYACEVIHDPNNSFNGLEVEVDLSLLETTGLVYVGYKGNKYGCSVK